MPREQYIRGGTDEAGYEIWLEPEKNLMHIHIWGGWTEPLAREYSVDCDRLSKLCKPPWFALVDARDAPIQIPVVKKLRGEVIARALVDGLCRIAYLTSEVLPMWQAQRMAQASGCRETECFSSEPEALVWLVKGGPRGAAGD